MLAKLARDSLTGMTGGFIIWSIYFVVVYAFLSIGCVAGLDRTRVLGMDSVRAVLAALSLGTLFLIAFFAWRSVQAARGDNTRTAEAPHRPFLAWLAALIAGLAWISTLWVAAPILLIAPCHA